MVTVTQTRSAPISRSLSLSNEYNHPDFPRREKGNATNYSTRIISYEESDGLTTGWFLFHTLSDSDVADPT